MTTVFIGGSRHVTRLPLEIEDRLNNIIKNNHHVLLGDANGVDRAVQKHFSEAGYQQVTVFCTGPQFRNNIGNWPTHHVQPPAGARGFQFYAAKDREMATKADFGLMIWDGKSAGTLLNILRLAKADKISVLYNVPQKQTLNIAPSHWATFFSHCSDDLKNDLKARATRDEWEFQQDISQKDAANFTYFKDN